ncbi:MAG TPA: hypothetical protein VJN50_01815 [Actinomycetota bacterium]|nr:hypothetical protein [Actinomycetota bacterium]
MFPLLWLASGSVLVAASAGAVLRGPGTASGLVALAAGIVLVLGRRAATRRGSPEDRMASSFLDRAFDGCVLGAVAWVSRDADPAVALGALLALSLSFLAAYVRARGAALGYGIGESGVTAGLRYALVVIGVAYDALAWTIWGVAGLSALSLLVRSSQVVKEERA